MKRFVPNHFGELARTYWQPLVLALLSILAFSQIIAWGVSAIELKKVDNLITETEETKTAPGDAAHTGKPGEPKNKPPGKNAKKDPQKPAKNIFKKEHTNYQLTAIYLDKAVVNGQAVSVGQNVGKGKLKEIGFDSVVIEEENGNERKVELFKGGSGGNGPVAPSNNSSKRPSKRRSGPQRADAPRANRGASPSAPPPGGAAFFKAMTEEQIKQMPQEEIRKRFESLSPSEKEQIKQHFQNTRRR